MVGSRETRLHLVDGLHFVGTTPSGHTIDLDSNVEGAASGATPMELQLVTLGGCSAMDTVSVLRKMRQEVSAYDVRLTSERAVEHPRVYTSIVMTHEIGGRDLSEAQVHRAIQLTMIRYCPVFAMLYPTVEIRERYEITDAVSGAVVAGEVAMVEDDAKPA
jgi:putative redox protein